MISAQEVVNGLTGALRLAGRDTSGYGHFDTSLDGFWRSFTAALLALPAYIIVTALRTDSVGIDASAFFLVEAIAYVTGWFAFPFAMLYVTDMLDRRERYITFIVATNWATAIQLSVIGLIASLEGIGLLPEGLAGFLSLVATLWIISYQWFIARTALEISGATAAAVVLLDLTLGLVVAGVAGAIEG